MQSGKVRNRKRRQYYDKEESAEHVLSKREKIYSAYNEEEKSSDVSHDSTILNSVKYYEKVLRDLRTGIGSEMRDVFIINVLQESEGKEIELSCHSLSSHCLELLLSQCKDTSVIQRFMTTFASCKIPACTSANASHITELLIHHAIDAIQESFARRNSTELEEKMFDIYCINWIVEFGNFSLENLDDFLSSQYACHVLSTLIRALAGDLTENKEFMSKNLKFHKQEFQSQFSDVNSPMIKEQKPVVLEQIPPSFSALLKKFYKSLTKLESLVFYINDGSSATVIEALIFALKKRHPKSCKKMINKITQKLFFEKNKDNVPLALLHKNASFVFDEMFKADEDLQLDLWNQYISNHIANLVVHPVGNFVIQRLYDAIKNRFLLETVCKHTWCLFDDIIKAKNYGIFVSIATACIRLGVQQSFYMENIMQCLQCFEPIQRQDLVIPLLLGFQKYEDYYAMKNGAENYIKVCLQGSLVVQAILKYQKPIKAVKSILNMSPKDIEYLAGHTQGCHVLNAFFGSITVGDKNKEMLLHHLQPVLVNMACDRNKSLTLSRIWICLPLKLKEFVARHLAQHQSTLKACKSGYAISMKFGFVHLKNLQEWRQKQSNLSPMNKQKQF